MDQEHFFVHLSEISRPRNQDIPSMIGVAGAEVACAHCGQVRKVWADGKVEITHDPRPDYANKRVCQR